MSVKDKLTSIFTLSSLTDASRSIWDIFVVRASVGCLFLAVILSLSGGLQYTTEGLLNIMAEKARLEPAPEGMINSYQCTDNPATEVTALPSVICSDFVVKTVSIEQAATASLYTVNFLLTAYYVFGGLLGNLIYILFALGRSMAPKIRPFISKQKGKRFEEDVNWCMKELKRHFIGKPYWEETTTAYFTRGNNIDEQYWKTVNQIATKQVTKTHPTLLYSEAYRELNRMFFFAINVIISSLDDIGINDKINSDALEKILTITHQELSVRAPSSLAEHDESLGKIQRCLNVFCSATDTPPTDFVYYSNNMNNLRITEISKTDDSSSGKRQQ